MRFWIIGVLAAMLGVTFYFSTLGAPLLARWGRLPRLSSSTG